MGRVLDRPTLHLNSSLSDPSFFPFFISSFFFSLLLILFWVLPLLSAFFCSLMSLPSLPPFLFLFCILFCTVFASFYSFSPSSSSFVWCFHWFLLPPHLSLFLCFTPFLVSSLLLHPPCTPSFFFSSPPLLSGRAFTPLSLLCHSVQTFLRPWARQEKNRPHYLRTSPQPNCFLIWVCGGGNIPENAKHSDEA